MPTVEEELRGVARVLSDLQREEGIEYVTRHDRYELHPDLSLEVQRILTLRSRAREAIHCLPTSLESDVKVLRSEIGFEVRVINDRHRRAFSVPAVVSAAGAAPEVDREVRLVGLIPALEPRDEISLEFRWRWPRHWTLLRDRRKDELSFHLDRPAQELKVTFCKHKELKAKTGIDFSATPRTEPDQRKDYATGPFSCGQFIYSRPGKGDFIFDLSAGG